MNPVPKILKALPKMRSMLVEYTESYKTRIVELLSYSNFFLRLILSKEKYTIPLLIPLDRDILWNKIKYFLCVRVCNCSVVSSSFATTVNYSQPGFFVPGILQARILEWVAVSSSRWSSWPRNQTHVSCIAGRLLTTVPPRKPKRFFRSVELKIFIAIMEIAYWKGLENYWTVQPKKR